MQINKRRPAFWSYTQPTRLVSTYSELSLSAKKGVYFWLLVLYVGGALGAEIVGGRYAVLYGE